MKFRNHKFGGMLYMIAVMFAMVLSLVFGATGTFAGKLGDTTYGSAHGNSVAPVSSGSTAGAGVAEGLAEPVVLSSSDFKFSPLGGCPLFAEAGGVEATGLACPPISCCNRSAGVVGALAVLLWAVKGSIGHNTPEHGLPSRSNMRRYMLMGLYCNREDPRNVVEHPRRHGMTFNMRSEVAAASSQPGASSQSPSTNCTNSTSG